MSLTDDYMQDKLKSGYYYVKNKACVEIDYYCDDYEYSFFLQNDKEFVEEVLAQVPNYEEYNKVKKEADYLNDECHRLSLENTDLVFDCMRLEKENKHLLDLQANQDKEVEILRDLLKECKNIVAHDLWARAEFADGQIVEKDNLLKSINAAIGESEE